MFFNTAGVASNTVLVTPFLVAFFWLGTFCPSRTEEFTFFILVGMVAPSCASSVAGAVDSAPDIAVQRGVCAHCWPESLRLMGFNPSQPRRIPTTHMNLPPHGGRTDLMTELRPGTSPPPVSMPIRFFAMVWLLLLIWSSDCAQPGELSAEPIFAFLSTKTTIDRGPIL